MLAINCPFLNELKPDDPSKNDRCYLGVFLGARLQRDWLWGWAGCARSSAGAGGGRSSLLQKLP